MEEASQRNEHNEESKEIDLISWLGSIKEDFDPVLTAARKHYSGKGWVGAWLIRSILGIKYIKVPENNVNKAVIFFSNHVTLWVAVLIGILGTGANEYIHLFSKLQPWPRTIGVLLIVVSLFMSLKTNLTRMLTLDDPYFTPSAYKIFRPREYLMFINYFKGNYNFAAVYKHVELLYRHNSLESLVQEHNQISKELRADKQKLTDSLNENKKSLDSAAEIIDGLNKQISILVDHITTNEQVLNTAIDVLYRLRSSDSLFHPSDLRVVAAFSLFEIQGKILYRHFEQGTTETPLVIRIDDPNFAHYSSVKLVNSEDTIEYATSDREGRTVASYWIDLASGRVLIYNFHYDSTNTKMSDIINSKEMYRLIRGICIHLEERGFFEPKEEVHDA